VIGQYPASSHHNHLQRLVQIRNWRQILHFCRKLDMPQPHVVSRIPVLIVFQSLTSLHVSLKYSLVEVYAVVHPEDHSVVVAKKP